MTEQTDSQLLSAYAVHRSEAAFAELVRRHLDLVYSAARRMVCEPELAQDVTQGTFLALAKNIDRLREHRALSSWLHRTAQNIAAQTVRTDVRRRAREQEAATMNELIATEPDASWERIAPHLDEALGELSEPDRDALLLRYFESKTLRTVGEQLGISDDAAQKRVSRAVERLREFFARRGITVGAGGLIVVISANAVQAAPVGLATTISVTVLAGAAVSTATVVAATTKTIAMTTLQKALVTATVAVLAGTALYETRQASRVRDENQRLIVSREQLASERDDAVNRLTSLSRKPAPRLPAPRIQLAAPPTESPPDNAQSTKLILQLLHSDKPLQLAPEQVGSYLKENRRSAASLLAAYRTSGDPALLEEAMQKYPNDPQVAFAAALKKDASPEERRQWLDAFKQSAPNNSLANYLSALDYFKAGQTDQAIQELSTAYGKAGIQDYWLAFTQDAEEAYRAAGYSDAEAKVAATSMRLPDDFLDLMQLSQSVIGLANSYRQTGDETSAQAMLDMGLNLGRQLDQSTGPCTLPQYAMGLRIESQILGAMDPNSPYGSGGQTVKDQLDHIAQQRAALGNLLHQRDGLLQMLPEQDWISYSERVKVVGGWQALQWLVNKYGQK